MIIALMAVSASAFGQKNKVQLPKMPVNSETGLITYSGNTTLGSASAADLYDRAFKWAMSYYKNPAEKLRKQDKENGRMEIFARFKIYAHDKKGELTTSQIGLVQYSMDIDFKDGKYRYIIHKINERASSYKPVEAWLKADDPNMANNAYKLMDMDAEIKKVIASFQTAMTTVPKAEDDW